ncbi:MAG: cytochrome P450 [Sphingomonadales bacterium]|nr:MAG: cytochrome P450 [Sphingomonadales bacterium]
MDQAQDLKKCPIDFDHESEDHVASWPAEFREMRDTCPVAWTERHGGFWVATRYKDIVAMAQDDATFSSFKTFDPHSGDVSGGITIPATPIPRGLPVESDRPDWDVFRKFLNRRFAPKAAEARRQNIRRYADSLLNRVIETGEMDLVNDFTGPVPAMTTMELMGLPLEEWRQFADPLHEMVFTPKNSPDFPKVIADVQWIFQRCIETFHQRRSQPPQDDLLSYFAHEQIDGRPITEEEMLSFCNNIITGGVDTTTALTTHALVYLNEHPEDYRRLKDDPSLLPVAREEFVRYFTPIHGLARNVTRDVEVNNARMEKGDRVYLAWAAANRDPEIFDAPEEVDIARFPNRHIAFGAGMHRCIGSFMARVMFEEMMQAVFARIPDYRVDPERAHRYTSVGTINGWIDMPTVFTPGPRVETGLVL